ncbi:MAG: fibronectin type III domain-containing protein, partial [Nitrososphaerales archaeon]
MRSHQLLLLAISCALVLSFSFPAFGQTAPSAPPFLSATVASSSQINLSWTVPSGSPTTYKIEYKIGQSTTVWTLLNGNTGPVTSYSHAGLQSGSYFYRIYAINPSGTSNPSPIAFVDLAPAQNIVPGPPTGVSAIAVSPNKITISWNAPAYNGGPSVTGYKIDFKISQSGTYQPLTSNTGDVTTFSHGSLTTGTTYYYKVSAINSMGPSVAAPEISATPTATSSSTAPNPPTNLVATQISSNQIDLSWSAPSSSSPITGYKIEEKIGTGAYSIINQNTGNTNTAYSRTGLSSGTTYYYRVSAINSAGTGNPSNEVAPGQTTTGVPNPPTSLSVAP